MVPHHPAHIAQDEGSKHVLVDRDSPTLQRGTELEDLKGKEEEYKAATETNVIENVDIPPEDDIPMVKTGGIVAPGLVSGVVLPPGAILGALLLTCLVGVKVVHWQVWAGLQHDLPRQAGIVAGPGVKNGGAVVAC